MSAITFTNAEWARIRDSVPIVPKTPREEAALERRLREDFGIPDPNALIDFGADGVPVRDPVATEPDDGPADEPSGGLHDLSQDGVPRKPIAPMRESTADPGTEAARALLTLEDRVIENAEAATGVPFQRGGDALTTASQLHRDAMPTDTSRPDGTIDLGPGVPTHEAEPTAPPAESGGENDLIDLTGPGVPSVDVQRRSTTELLAVAAEAEVDA